MTMEDLANKYFALMRQEYPKSVKGDETAYSFMHHAIVAFVSRNDEYLSICPILATTKEPVGSKAYCEESYEQGYMAIINDGKLLGFRLEVEDEEE